MYSTKIVMEAPLAERIRPKKLEDYIGQSHLVGPKGTLRLQIQNGLLSSMILWGPPGVGKTTLAEILAQASKRPFYALSAIHSGVKEVREVIEKAKGQPGLFTPQNPIVFIDEIHRFSKSQQDSLLAAVERGWITLIGATTENPSFEVIPALLSRCQVYVLEAFGKAELELLVKRALETDPWMQQFEVSLTEMDALLRVSGGDGRKLLNLLELVVRTQAMHGAKIEITNALVWELAQTTLAHYDKNGEQHYDIISAFIKSIRGSDPNAAVYWLARLIEGGENLEFIARRLLILASEDIGNANPTALIMAQSTFQSVRVIGYPESRIILSQCAVYLASSPKSNSSYLAINKAQELVKETGDLPVPLHLRNAPTKLMKELGYGNAYQYAHDYEGNFVEQEFMPKTLEGHKLFEPGKNSREEQLRAYLKSRWKDKYSY